MAATCCHPVVSLAQGLDAFLSLVSSVYPVISSQRTLVEDDIHACCLRRTVGHLGSRKRQSQQIFIHLRRQELGRWDDRRVKQFDSSSYADKTAGQVNTNFSPSQPTATIPPAVIGTLSRIQRRNVAWLSPADECQLGWLESSPRCPRKTKACWTPANQEWLIR